MLKTLVCFAILFAVSVDAEASIKIGYVDMQKAIQATKVGKKAKKTLENEFKKKKKELQAKEKSLKAMGKDLEKRGLVMSEEVKAQKQREFQEEMIKYREMVGKSQLEIQQKERKLTEPIIKKLKKILDGIGKKEGYTVILERSENAVMWAQKSIDLTDRVVKDFDKGK